MKRSEIDTSIKLYKQVLEKYKGKLGEHEAVLKYLIEELSSRKGGLTTKQESNDKIMQLENYFNDCLKKNIRPNIKYICRELSISERSYYDYKNKIFADDFSEQPKPVSINQHKKDKQNLVQIPKYFDEVANRKRKPKSKKAK